MPSTRQSSRTSRPSGNSRATKSTRRSRRIVYLTEVDIAHAAHRLAEIWFTPENYGEPMPAFEFDGRQGLERFLGAVALPRQSFYRTLDAKAAALFRSLIKDHPLRDGNKRLAVTALQVFLIVNRVDFKLPQDLMVQTALTIATYPGNFSLEAVQKWIRAGCVGRPRSIITTLAEEWPEARERLLYESRRADIAAGKRSRIPGRRVRLSRAFWDRIDDNVDIIIEGQEET